MRLVDVIPEADVLCALEPDELALRMLPVLAEWQPRNRLRQSVQLSLAAFLQTVFGLSGRPSDQYPVERTSEVDRAIREAWSWLEGSALLVSDPQWQDLVRQLSRRAEQLAQEPNPFKPNEVTCRPIMRQTG
jgi:hypothetical protein